MGKKAKTSYKATDRRPAYSTGGRVPKNRVKLNLLWIGPSNYWTTLSLPISRYVSPARHLEEVNSGASATSGRLEMRTRGFRATQESGGHLGRSRGITLLEDTPPRRTRVNSKEQREDTEPSWNLSPDGPSRVRVYALTQKGPR